MLEQGLFEAGKWEGSSSMGDRLVSWKRVGVATGLVNRLSWSRVYLQEQVGGSFCCLVCKSKTTMHGRKTMHMKKP